MIYTSLLNFSFWFCIVFLISLNCPSAFSCCASLKQLFEFFIGTLQIINHVFEISYWKITVLFDDVKFPWFFMFLKVLHYHLHIWSGSQSLQFLLTTFMKEIPFFSLAGDSEAFLNTPAPCFLLPLRDRILKLTAFSKSCNTPSQVLTTLSKFKAQICGLSLASRFWLALYTHSLAVWESSLLHHCQEGTQGAGQRARGEVWRFLWATWEESQVRDPQPLVGWLLDGVHLPVGSALFYIQLMSQHSGWGAIECAPIQLGKARYSLSCSHFPSQ